MVTTRGKTYSNYTKEHNLKKSNHTATRRHKNTQKRQQIMNKGAMDLHNSQKTIKKMSIVCPCLSIITLNVHKLNSTVKIHKMAEWIKKQDSTIGCLKETHFSLKTHID